ncbi:MAG: hypothetical protein KatS3mg026_0725 [Bacteroidia bacterium]|nr:MAG: hypothetical protein KatS3mg026_0725 [Bacteroidia bacterium]
MRYLVVLLSLGLAGLWAQLSGPYTVGGSAANYPHLTAAFSALMSQGVSGDVEFRLTAAYAGEPGGTPTLRLTAYPGMGTYSVKLTVDPSVTTPVTVATPRRLRGF